MNKYFKSEQCFRSIATIVLCYVSGSNVVNILIRSIVLDLHIYQLKSKHTTLSNASMY